MNGLINTFVLQQNMGNLPLFVIDNLIHFYNMNNDDIVALVVLNARLNKL